LLVCLMTYGVMLLAEASGSTANTGWWTSASGILAIPIAIIGVILTVFTIRKTNLESQKIQLEIREKEGALKLQSTTEARNAEQAVVQPIIDSALVQNLLVRAILLFVILEAWGLLTFPFTAFQRWGIIGHLLAFLPSLSRYLVVYGIGAPLMVDALMFLNIDVPRPLRAFAKPSRIGFIAVGLILLLCLLALMVGSNSILAG
jgi:hypothetical protein